MKPWPSVIAMFLLQFVAELYLQIISDGWIHKTSIKTLLEQVFKMDLTSTQMDST